MPPPISECPAATGQSAEKTKPTAASVGPAENFSNPDKRLATLRARAALAGVVLHAIEGDFGKTIYIVSRWNLTRQLDSMEAAEARLDQVTGARA